MCGLNVIFSSYVTAKIILTYAKPAAGKLWPMAKNELTPVSVNNVSLEQSYTPSLTVCGCFCTIAAELSGF